MLLKSALMNKNEKWLRRLPWLVVLGVMAGIFCMSTAAFSAHHTAVVFGSYNFYARKTAHLTEYALLFLVLRFALSRTVPGRNRVLISMLTVVLCAMYAASDEWHQSFVPGRTASVVDVCIDTCGAILGAVVWTAAGMFRKFKGGNTSR